MITSKEWYIMQVLWENGACSLMEIVEGENEVFLSYRSEG